MNTYTVYAMYDGMIEELDVRASDAEQAREKAEAVLTDDYLPGWEIIRIEERHTVPGWTAVY